MNKLLIFQYVYLVFFIVFSIYYIIIKKKDNANIEIRDKIYFYKKDNNLLFIFLFLILSTSTIRYLNSEILKDILYIVLGLLLGLMSVLFLENHIKLKKKSYKNLKNKVLLRYLVVMGICIFVIYPMLYLSIYFLFK